MYFINPTQDPLPKINNDNYVIDTKWFRDINCRHPMYQCINFIEYFILDDNGNIVDDIKITSKPISEGIYIVDKETYIKIKKYMQK